MMLGVAASRNGRRAVADPPVDRVLQKSPRSEAGRGGGDSSRPRRRRPETQQQKHGRSERIDDDDETIVDGTVDQALGGRKHAAPGPTRGSASTGWRVGHAFHLTPIRSKIRWTRGSFRASLYSGQFVVPMSIGSFASNARSR